MTEGSTRQSENASFPLLRTFGDPVIENIDGLPPTDEIGLAPPAGVLAREPSAAGERYFVFAREITDYSELPITVGGATSSKSRLPIAVAPFAARRIGRAILFEKGAMLKMKGSRNLPR